MSKRKARQQQMATQAALASRRKRKVLGVIALLLSLSLAGGIVAQWRATRVATGMNALLSPAPVATSPGSPSKEYIYAGGRLIATEEPVTNSTANQTITFDPIPDQTYGLPPFTINATASSNLPVSFSVISGAATISSNTVTIIEAGTVTIRASQAGDSTYTPAVDVDRVFMVTKAMATITLSNRNQNFDGTPKSITATTSPVGLSGVTIIYSQNGQPVTSPTNPGSYAVIASLNNANYQASDVTDTLVIATAAKTDQTINFNQPPDKTYGDPLFEVSASSSSGLPVSLSIVSGPATVAGNTVTLIGAGTVIVRASQAGNDSYNAAPSVDRSFTVAKAAATITLSNLQSYTYDGTAKNASATTNPPGLSVSFAYSLNGQSVSQAINAGSYVVTATINDTNYQGTKSDIFVINKVTPVITWNAPAKAGQGTSLSSTQLNATANVPGSFSYSPGAGSILSRLGDKILNTTFTPTDTVNFNGATKSVHINVVACPGYVNFHENQFPSISFSADHYLVAPGTSVTLTWNISYATNVTISGIPGTFTDTGSQTVTPSATTTYTLTATGDSVCAPYTKELTITVGECPNGASAFTASAYTVAPGTAVTLSWNIPQATDVSIASRRYIPQRWANQTWFSFGIFEGGGQSGSTVVNPQETEIYVLNTAALPFGCSVPKTIPINVTENPTPDLQGCSNGALFGSGQYTDPVPPGTQYFETYPYTLLYWDIPQAASVTITDTAGVSYGTFSGRTGEIAISPTTTATYILSAITNRASPCSTFTMRTTVTSGGPPEAMFRSNPVQWQQLLDTRVPLMDLLLKGVIDKYRTESD